MCWILLTNYISGYMSESTIYDFSTLEWITTTWHRPKWIGKIDSHSSAIWFHSSCIIQRRVWQGERSADWSLWKLKLVIHRLNEGRHVFDVCTLWTLMVTVTRVELHTFGKTKKSTEKAKRKTAEKVNEATRSYSQLEPEKPVGKKSTSVMQMMKVIGNLIFNCFPATPLLFLSFFFFFVFYRFITTTIIIVILFDILLLWKICDCSTSYSFLGSKAWCTPFLSLSLSC